MSTESPFARAGGTIVHPTSLASPFGVGDFGIGARQFVDWLAASGLSLWQVLPLVPPGAGNSPYSSGSAFMGSPWLIDLVDLRGQGLLDPDDLDAPDLPAERVDYAAMQAFKWPRLKKAAERLLSRAKHPLREGLDEFRHRSSWVADATLFYALRARYQGQPWWAWPTGVREREPAALSAARGEVEEMVEVHTALQFLFDRQLEMLRARCAERGIRLIGDVPIYVDGDSADVWANRQLFQLDAGGRRESVAGVPPDAFSETGQLWGNPLYRWDRMAEDGFAWWRQRLVRALGQTDFVRIDHFRGFAAYWSVPSGASDARAGRWIRGPGLPLFDALRQELGGLPIIAEDLGIIDEPVRTLLAETGLPGMLVLHFAFGEDARNAYLPHNHHENAVVYTGTHDNDTTRSWWASVSEHVRDHVRRYYGIDGHDLVWNLIRSALASPAIMAIVPMQDVQTHDGWARMNTPAVPTGNWEWRMGRDALRPDLAERLRGLAELYGRDKSRPIRPMAAQAT